MKIIGRIIFFNVGLTTDKWQNLGLKQPEDRLRKTGP